VPDERRITPDSTVVTTVSANPLAEQKASAACLVVILGAEIGKRITLDERELVLGRSSGADVQLDIDNVSRHHASVVRVASGWVLRDLDSTNGTSVCCVTATRSASGARCSSF
jgi:two-component system cell cycle response regulator